MVAKLRSAARRYWLSLLLIGALGGVGIGVFSPDLHPTRGGPWHRGDWWVVSTRLPPDPLRMATLNWVPGPTYRFTVLEARRARGQDCWRVALDQLPAAGAPARLAELFYTRDRLALVDGRYFAPGGQVIDWPAAMTYLQVPVVLVRLEGVARGRPVNVPRRGFNLKAEALDVAPGQTQVWSGGAPWWVRFYAEGRLKAELVDASWWYSDRRPDWDWRQVLEGPAGDTPFDPFQPLPRTVPSAAAGETAPARERPVGVMVWLNGQIVGELKQGKLPWQRGTAVLSLRSRREEQVGVLYFSLIDPDAGRIRLERLVLTRPQYLDRSLVDLEGVCSGGRPLSLTSGDLRVQIELGALQ